MYLEIAGEDQPIPVYPLAPGSGHQPFTVKVASPHLDDPEPAETPSKTPSKTPSEAPHRPTSQVPSAFEPPASVQPFSAVDAGGSTGSRPPAAISDSFGTGFFESGAEFGRSPPRFPNFQTTFEGVRSRRRGARRLFPPAEVNEVTAEVGGVSAQLSPDAKPEYTGGKVSK